MTRHADTRPYYGGRHHPHPLRSPGVVRPPDGLDHLAQPYFNLAHEYGEPPPVGEDPDEVIFYPGRATRRLKAVGETADEIVWRLP